MALVETDQHVLLLGLSGAGKSTLLCRLKGEDGNPPPTVTFDTQNIVVPLNTQCWIDVSGQDQMRDLWHNYYEGMSALVFVIDASDEPSLPNAIRALHDVLQHPSMQNISLMVLANKEDVSNAINIDTLRERIALNRPNNNEYRIIPTSANQQGWQNLVHEWVGSIARAHPERLKQNQVGKNNFCNVS
eukprot:TRINITY_DN11345_c0_g1_i3.p1 TRINITY_DN11345_c0_g1~~TRINITY_DN11345_c0_g1_i3.p1  ORF type:complete len:209 (-),score=23.00 TRINITY_DN11345_c0_g1_i3:42-605(-)